MRVVGWNVRDLLGDPLAVHRVLRELAPDIACLQEVPRRPGSALRLARLARGAGLCLVEGGRSAGGTAVLVAPSVDVLARRAVRLPVPHWHGRRRGAVLATVRTADGVVLTVASVHLPLTAVERIDHAQRVMRAMVAFGTDHHVIAGDLNEPEDGPAWQALRALVADPSPGAPPTFPARDPQTRIDAVLVSAAVRVVAYRPAPLAAALVARASDHLPVVADLSVDPR